MNHFKQSVHALTVVAAGVSMGLWLRLWPNWMWSGWLAIAGPETGSVYGLVATLWYVPCLSMISLLWAISACKRYVLKEPQRVFSGLVLTAGWVWLWPYPLVALVLFAIGLNSYMKIHVNE